MRLQFLSGNRAYPARRVKSAIGFFASSPLLNSGASIRRWVGGDRSRGRQKLASCYKANRAGSHQQHNQVRQHEDWWRYCRNGALVIQRAQSNCG